MPLYSLFTRIFFISISIALFVTLTACSNDAKQELRFGLASMPSNLDPRFATDASSSRIGRLIFQKLVDFNDAKKPVPAIADWEKINDKLYRFTLNDKVNNFHNGTTLTSKDVKATYDFILNKTNTI